MPQMSVTPGAENFSALHEQARVRLCLHTVVLYGPREARPSSARVELVVRVKELVAAANAAVHAWILGGVVSARKCPLRAALSCDSELLGSELFLPLLVCFANFFSH